MSKEDSIEVTGTVVEKFPSGLFSVQLDQDRTVLAHLAGKLRRNRIRVLAGDRVTLEMSPYDLTKGRITYRHKQQNWPEARRTDKQTRAEIREWSWARVRSNAPV